MKKMDKILEASVSSLFFIVASGLFYAFEANSTLVCVSIGSAIACITTCITLRRKELKSKEK